MCGTKYYYNRIHFHKMACSLLYQVIKILINHKLHEHFVSCIACSISIFFPSIVFVFNQQQFYQRKIFIHFFFSSLNNLNQFSHTQPNQMHKIEQQRTIECCWLFEICSALFGTFTPDERRLCIAYSIQTLAEPIFFDFHYLSVDSCNSKRA